MSLILRSHFGSAKSHGYRYTGFFILLCHIIQAFISTRHTGTKSRWQVGFQPDAVAGWQVHCRDESRPTFFFQRMHNGFR